MNSNLCYRLLLAEAGGWGDEGCEELALFTWRVLFLFGDESGVDVLAGELLANPWSLSLRRAKIKITRSSITSAGLVLGRSHMLNFKSKALNHTKKGELCFWYHNQSGKQYMLLLQEGSQYYYYYWLSLFHKWIILATQSLN